MGYVFMRVFLLNKNAKNERHVFEIGIVQPNKLQSKLDLSLH